jgi:hypothetical protein
MSLNNFEGNGCQMINQCPHCKKDLNLTASQKEKIQTALKKLKPEQVLKFGCPHCQQTVEMRKEEAAGSQDAFDVFPDLMGGSSGPQETPEDVVLPAEPNKQETTLSAGEAPLPPNPPDISWLETGELGEKAQSVDAAAVLILMPDGDSKSLIAKAFQKLDYRVEYANTLAETMEKMLATRYPAIVLHTAFEGVALDESRVHNHMKWLPMSKRRYIYYVLIGPELETLYDLEALSLSANLVINEKDLDHLHRILRKGFHDHEKLFEPFLESIEKHRNR